MSYPSRFQLVSDYQPAGDQPKAIDSLVSALKRGATDQTLLGVTGSGKTFTMANVIAEINQPTLVIAHNKTLAAQLTQEFRTFFPNNAVEYFVSYYDYYQPEAYLPGTDTYIEKEADINDEIDRLRHSATTALLSRRDVIVVGSVSVIYGLGSPKEYEQTILRMKVGEQLDRQVLLKRLTDMYYARGQTYERGTFFARGSTIEIVQPSSEYIVRIQLERDRIEAITLLHPTSRSVLETPEDCTIFPAKHFVVAPDVLNEAIRNIEKELQAQLASLKRQGKIAESDRLQRRTNHDIALMKEIGYCNGIENYSRHLSGRASGQPPETLLDYFRSDFLTIIDESHVTIPQIRGMHEGDRARKETLIDYGFRLPSALDNRPLRFPEFEERTRQRIYLSATPGLYEKQHSSQIVEQLIRPTGLVDPIIEIQPIVDQVSHAIKEIETETKQGQRVLVTTLTKKMAEDLSNFLKEKNVKSRYLHSEVDTLDRIRTLEALRRGECEVLVGVNLLREGLDLPEVSLVLILDADKEGFLRSETSLIQTIGRAARNIRGRVILYADKITPSMHRALEETDRRRETQIAFNEKHGITPTTISKNITSIVHDVAPVPELARTIDPDELPSMIRDRELSMKNLAKELRFEEAALVRDEVLELKKLQRVIAKR